MNLKQLLLLYSILLIFPKLLCAQSTEQPLGLLDYSNGMRVLTVDIESLTEGDPLLAALEETIQEDQKAHPDFALENNFLLGVLSYIKKNDQKAHEYFQKIPKNTPLHSTVLFYDGIALRSLGENSPIQKEQLCETSMSQLRKVEDFSPRHLMRKQPKELMLSTFCYFEALIQKGRIGSQDAEWLRNVLENSSKYLDQEKRQGLYFQYLDRLKKDATREEQRVFVEFGLKLFPTSKRILQQAKTFQLKLPEKEKEKDLAETEPEAHIAYKAAKKLMSSGKPLDALKAFTSIVTTYPGSETSEKSKETILSIVRRNVRYQKSVNSFQEELKKLPPSLIFKIAKYLWNRDYNLTAYGLYSHITKKYPYYSKASDAYYSLGNMHEDWSEWSKAIGHYENLVQKHPKSRFSERAHFKVGFLYYLSNNYPKALQWLAKEKRLVKDFHQKAQAAYWLGRTYQKMNRSADAKAQFDEIRKKYPLTYYAFLLGLDNLVVTKGQIQFPKLEIGKEHPLYTAAVFLRVGLHKPARRMIQEYGNENEEHLYQIVQLFHDTGFHVFSIPNALVLSQKRMKKWGLEEELLRKIFPVKHQHIVEKKSDAAGIDPILVTSLIKQESGYFERAISRAGAIGLMQLLPRTAKTLARNQKRPIPSKLDLFDPNTNVTYGIDYLRKLDKDLDKDVVLMLAAYNAGPHRAKKWKNRWGQQVERDEFVELIPFSETRKYVKLILRNYVHYKLLLENKKTNVKDFGF